MTRHVILLTDAHEAPAPTLVEHLRDAGVAVFVEGLREAEMAGRTLAHESERLAASAPDEPRPSAILYEVYAGADIVEIHAAVEHAHTIWPNIALVACRHRTNGHTPAGARVLDHAALKRLGFRFIADEPAQLPALLREMEDRGVTGELKLPQSQKQESPFLLGALLLPARLRTESLRAAFDLVSSLHFAVDQKSAAHTAISGLAPLVEADRWAIYLTSESDASALTLEPLAVRGLTSSEREIPEKDWRRALLGESLALYGAESKSAREAAAQMETVRRRERERRVVAVPLINSERVFGVIEAVREGKGRRTFSRADIELLNALAVPIASALANSVRIAEAERLSQTDDLTKLHNARYLRQYLTSEIKRARRYGSNVAAIFLDLDDFKRVNDLYGHLVGSHVLMEMAAVILASVRDTDVVARYGGDEYVVVMPETNIEAAARVAERLREKTERHEFTGGRRLRLKLTASFGVAAFPQHAQSPQQLVACADTAMYEAKAAHKNCICLSAEAGPYPPRD